MAKKATTETKTVSPAEKASFVFGKENYRLMIIGLVVIIIGFALMSGTEDIMSFNKITLAPILVLLGFGIEFAAILKKTKDN